MKNQILIIVFIFFINTINAQQVLPNSHTGKGATPITISNKPIETKNTYAVVVGISDYQDPAIPNLRFADKDAEAFANYLRSESGGKLDGDHLKVLLNEKATVAQFAIALDWLMEVVKENDQVIIYFSGHGDVEKKTITQPGYLLCWDAPSRVYLAGGALALPMFQDIITTLSAQNKAKVVVITDACRSGKLAGSSVGGSQITGANLAKQYSNEIKILSCQPNEYSIEGEQWGGGRGAFSYHLLDALYGMADHNNDLIVNLQEAGRYIEDHVSEEVAPVSQVPVILGNRVDVLSKVDSKILASLKSGKSSQVTFLSSVDSRGMEEDVLSNVDSSVHLSYQLFKKALEDKIFFSNSIDDKNSSTIVFGADSLFNQLIQESKLERLHSTMKRNYAAALQDDAQQVMNTLLKTGLTSYVLSNITESEQYRNYPAYLQRAAELLGEKHYMYAPLQARKYFFEGKIRGNKKVIKSAYLKALEWQPDMPHVFMEMITICDSIEVDSAEFFRKKANELVPNWIVPYCNLSVFYQSVNHNNVKAEEMLNMAGALDSNSIFVWYSKGMFYYKTKQDKQSEQWLLKTIESTGEDICFPCASNALARIYLHQNQFQKAEKYFRNAIQLDSNFKIAYVGLGAVYAQLGRYTEAESALKKNIELGNPSANTFLNLAGICTETGRFVEGEAYALRCLEIDSTSSMAYSTLGNIYYQLNNYNKAEKYLLKSISINPNNPFPYSVLGSLFINMNRLEEAKTYFLKTIEIDKSNGTAWVNLGGIYLEAKDYKHAIYYFQQALKVERSFTHPYSHLGLGKCYLQQSQFTEAIQEFNKAISFNPDLSDIYLQLGIVYLKTNNAKEARESFQKAIELSPKDGAMMLGIAYFFISEGKVDEAFAEVELAIKNGITKEQLEKDEDLAPLRMKGIKWNTLMKKNFPEKM